jgi:GDP-L-fucose synthase
MNKTSKIYVAGHRGLVGSALVRKLLSMEYANLVRRTHRELDLCRLHDVETFLAEEKPEYVFLAAAKVGGIYANSRFPVDFLLKNLKIQNNVIEAAWRCGVKGLLFLGSSCIYPKHAPQPITEESLLTGPLEPTNEPYAIAKIAGIELCEAYNRQHGTHFLSVMPTNLYGPNDHYDLEHSHVLPSLIRKFHLAKLALEGDWEAIRFDESLYGRIPEDVMSGLKETPLVVRLWGSGSPRREFLHVADLADACIFLMERLEHFFSERCVSFPDRHIINIGCGTDLSVRELAELVARVVGFDGALDWDSSKPDGTPRTLLDVNRLSSMGWQSSVSLEEGVRRTYEDYRGALSHRPYP